MVLDLGFLNTVHWASQIVYQSPKVLPTAQQAGSSLMEKGNAIMILESKLHF